MAFDWMSWLRKIIGGGGAPIPLPPATRYVRQPLTGVVATTVPPATATLQMDEGAAIPGAWDVGGWFLFALPTGTPAPYGGTVTVIAAWYRDVSQRFVLRPIDTAHTTQELPPLAMARVPPEPPPPTPIPPNPPPTPPPPPAPTPSKDAIVLSLAQPACTERGQPDVRQWPIAATISLFTLAEREVFERGDTMIEFNGRDVLPVAMGSQGAIAYTLWTGFNIHGQWYILPIVECIRGYVPTGQLLSPGQLPQNLTYFANDPVKGYQPKPGEEVVFFATTGDTRRQNAQAEGFTPWRTNVILIPFRPGTVAY